MSIADKITSMTNHLEKDYQALESVVGTVSVNKNIENIAPLLDNLWEDLPHTTGSGTSPSISGTRAGKMKVNLLGNTSQTGTPTPSTPIDVNVVSGDNEVVVTGKNLFNYSDYLGVGGATCNYTANKITVVNSNGGENKFAFFLLGKDELLGKTITIYSNMTGSTGGIRLYYGNSNNGIVSGISGIYYPTDSKWTLTISNSFPSSTDRILILFYSNFSEASSGTTMVFGNTQVELGSSVSTYEPYQSSTYPIHLGTYELCKIGTYQDKFIRNSGKNLLNLTDGTYTSNGITTTITNGVIHSSGTTDSTWFNLIANSSYTLKAGTYTFSIDSPISTNTLTLALKGASWHNFTIAKNGTSATLTLDEDIDTISITTGGFSSGTAINFTIHTMLNEGSTALPYEPYGTNEWYLNKQIGKVVLDGSETWKKSGTYQGSFYLQAPVPTIMFNNLIPFSQLYCTHFTRANIDSAPQISSNYVRNTSFIENNSGVIDMWYDDGTATVEQWEEWLSNNTPNFYFPMFTPTYTKIEGTLKDELDDVWRAYSYNEQTNVSQSNNDLPFELSITALEG